MYWTYNIHSYKHCTYIGEERFQTADGLWQLEDGCIDCFCSWFRIAGNELQSIAMSRTGMRHSKLLSASASPSLTRGTCAPSTPNPSSSYYSHTCTYRTHTHTHTHTHLFMTWATQSSWSASSINFRDAASLVSDTPWRAHWTAYEEEPGDYGWIQWPQWL